MKKLKTGDVKRYKAQGLDLMGDSWVTCGGSYGVMGFSKREGARFCKSDDERIARILSIGPKYVTVRISK